MQKYVLAALLASCTIAGRIPLSKKVVSKAAFYNYKETAEAGQPVTAGSLGNHIPLKDYMNT